MIQYGRNHSVFAEHDYRQMGAKEPTSRLSTIVWPTCIDDTSVKDFDVNSVLFAMFNYATGRIRHGTTMRPSFWLIVRNLGILWLLT